MHKFLKKNPLAGRQFAIAYRFVKNRIRHLVSYLSRYLDKELAKSHFRSSSQAATHYYQSNLSALKDSGPFSAVPRHKQTCLLDLRTISLMPNI